MKFKKIEPKKKKNKEEMVFYYSSKEIILAILFIILQAVLFLVYQNRINNLEKTCNLRENAIFQYPNTINNTNTNKNTKLYN